MKNSRETSGTIQLNAFTGGFNTQKGISFDEQDYFELTDRAEHAVHPNKKGSILNGLPSLFTRLGMSKENWIEAVACYEKHFSDYVGQKIRIRDAGAYVGYEMVKGFMLLSTLIFDF